VLIGQVLAGIHLTGKIAVGYGRERRTRKGPLGAPQNDGKPEYSDQRTMPSAKVKTAAPFRTKSRSVVDTKMCAVGHAGKKSPGKKEINVAGCRRDRQWRQDGLVN